MNKKFFRYLLNETSLIGVFYINMLESILILKNVR